MWLTKGKDLATSMVKRIDMFQAMAELQTPSITAEREIVGGKIGFLVAQVARAATRRYVKAFAPAGINPRQTAVLFELRRDGATSQRALSKVLDVDPTILVGLLNFLEDEGLAIRRRDPTDRRRHVVEITKLGIKRLAVVEHAARQTENEFFAPLSLEEREQLTGLLMRLAATTQAEPISELLDVDGDQHAPDVKGPT
jgi:DNA-binding MarR family transcriptional regulator